MKGRRILVTVTAIAIMAAQGVAVTWALGVWSDYGYYGFSRKPVAISDQPVAYDVPDVVALRGLLLSGRYRELERSLADAQAGYYAGTRREIDYLQSFAIFSSVSPDVGTAIDRWIKEMPESAIALTARGKFYRSRMRSSFDRDDVRPPLGPTPAAGETIRRALGDLGEALKRDKENLIAWREMLYVVGYIGKQEEAREIFEKALTVAPGSYGLHSHMLYLLTLNGIIESDGDGDDKDEDKDKDKDNSKAIETLMESARARMDDEFLLDWLEAEYVAGKGLERWLGGRAKRALRYYDQGLEIAEVPGLLVHRGVLLDWQGEHEEALANYRRALIYDPLHERAVNGIGEALWRLGERDEAERNFDRARELAPLNRDLIIARYRIYNDDELRDEALTELSRGLGGLPEDVDLLRYRGELRLEKLDDPQGAQEDVEAAIDANPFEARVLDLHVRVLVALEDCAATEALQTFEETCEASDDCSTRFVDRARKKVKKMTERLSCPVAGE